MKWILILIFVLKCHGFLLDRSTQQTPSGSMIDEKYNTLMDLLIAERRSRKNLEDAVSRELLALKNELSRCQCKPSNTQLTSNNETETLRTELLELRNTHNLLRLNFNKLEQNNTALSARITKLENLSVAQPSVNLTTTKELAEAIYWTDNKLLSVSNEVEARKQDFIALYHKVVETENKLENVTTTLKLEQNRIATDLRQNIVDSTSKIDQNLSGNISEVVVKQNNIAAKQNDIAMKLQGETVKLQQSIDEANNRVILTTCKAADAVNGIIQFTNIKTINGIKNSGSIKNSGVFTCEKPGLYIVSVYILSNTAGGSAVVTKNGYIISDAYIGTPNPYETSSATVVTQLTVNDKISVTGSVHVYGNIESCLTIVQIK